MVGLEEYTTISIPNPTPHARYVLDRVLIALDPTAIRRGQNVTLRLEKLFELYTKMTTKRLGATSKQIPYPIEGLGS